MYIPGLILDSTKLKENAVDKLDVDEMINSFFDRAGNIVGFFFRVFKTGDCLVKGQ